jgi:hypothetical protein
LRRRAAALNHRVLLEFDDCYPSDSQLTAELDSIRSILADATI